MFSILNPDNWILSYYIFLKEIEYKNIRIHGHIVNVKKKETMKEQQLNVSWRTYNDNNKKKSLMMYEIGQILVCFVYTWCLYLWSSSSSSFFNHQKLTLVQHFIHMSNSILFQSTMLLLLLLLLLIFGTDQILLVFYFESKYVIIIIIIIIVSELHIIEL